MQMRVFGGILIRLVAAQGNNRSIELIYVGGVVEVGLVLFCFV